MGVVLELDIQKGDEELYVFTSPVSKHRARMNILDERIIIEHDVDIVESAIFDITQRRAAIKWIEALFKAFAYDSDLMRAAYKEGYMWGTTHSARRDNPHTDTKLRNMWYRGFDNAQSEFIRICEKDDK